MKNAGFFALGAFIGSLLVGIAVLLTTPMSGAELRKEINDKANTLISDVKQASLDRQEELKEELEAFRLGKVIKIESRE